MRNPDFSGTEFEETWYLPTCTACTGLSERRTTLIIIYIYATKKPLKQKKENIKLKHFITKTEKGTYILYKIQNLNNVYLTTKFPSF